MDDKIIEFTHLLRENGLKVSAAENMDTFSALGLGRNPEPAGLERYVACDVGEADRRYSCLR